MSCPYLKEVRMVFCRAYPVKKLVPIDQVTTASSCETECAFHDCALFKDARAQMERSVDVAEPAGPEDLPTDSKKGATP
jgi:hypothetical protein